MPGSVKIRVLLLAVLLAAGQFAYATHIPAHANLSTANCDLCVCQAQTPAAPLPAADLPAAVPLPPTNPAAAAIAPAPRFARRGPQPRAPPVSV